MAIIVEPPLPLFKGGGIDLTKNPKKGGDGKIAEGQGDPKKRGGEFCRKEDAISLGILSSWGVANVTTVTFNDILVRVLLFPLNVGFSPCFHCTVLVSVYRVYTSCFHNNVVSSSYVLHTSYLHHAGATY